MEQADKMHDPKGGLSSEGRKHFKQKDGSNLKPGVKSYDSASTADKKRWISWATRFAGNPQPLKKPNGEPTNYALMFQAWGRPIPKTAADVKATYDLAMRRKKALGMGESSMREDSDAAAALEAAKAEPVDQELWDKCVALAKKKFNTYPSFYANMWVTQEYKKRGGKFKGSSGKDAGKPPWAKSEEAPTDEHAAVASPFGEGEKVEQRPGPYDLSTEETSALSKLRDGYTPLMNVAQTLVTGDYQPVVRAIGADAQAFMQLQSDSITNVLNDAKAQENAPESTTMAMRAAGMWNTSSTTTSERVPAGATDEANASVPIARAFVTHAHGKTMLTGPAATFSDGWQKALGGNEHMLWIQGRLVGGETPNRNNALWTAGDLEMGQPTVAHGPLNWLHESRHIIGHIAESRFVPARTNNGSETAAETVDPHIVAAANVWRWIYPDEAMVVEQSSELNQLWYSMECVSKDVVCSGADGCGHTTDYFTFARDEPGTCEHMRERSTTLRFAEPTFLGAAVIVPPTRPGWADADARVLAASMSEKAFDQAGKPDIPASTFEQLVGQVVAYAAS